MPSTDSNGGNAPSSARELSISTEARLRLPEYRLLPGDVIEVKFFYHPALNSQVPIRPDGKISLPLLDDVQAAGQPPAQLDAFLTRAYAQHLRDPEITVMVKEFAPRRVYVGGEVNNPGLIEIHETLTALKAIVQSGGAKNTANLASVVVLRYQGSEIPQFLIVNLEEDLSNAVMQHDIDLQPYDVVFVPKTFIATANQFVEQYIDKMIPIQRSIGVFWNFIPGQNTVF